MDKRLENLVDVVTALIDTLEPSGVEYAFGGAIALSAWSEPRATTDVDINLWISDEALPRAIELLHEAGVDIEENAARQSAQHRGMFVGKHGPYRVDVFVPSIPFYEKARATRRRIQLADRETWVLSAEALTVFKMLFFRAKDLVDIARLLEIAATHFDRDFVRNALVDVVGEDDERVLKWDEICAQAR